ncbi:hypothetical protein FNH05_04170 [Amycolatopsis rhizosphaerae]|uniref:Uncharacterized protein n=1 Tax=Amycolatopsis rhizosphaerae TaxID=2053003 RepID=A0A558DI03_9PSEU|nr:hypothetical protein [Amycolatopsis rhizosphaerae]TVT60573.1 hypothetical protein FNH05_04170 [Amycolatopsis rhizosphaerae]
MDTNVILFQVNGRDDDLLRGAAPAKAEDAVRQAWRQVQEERPIQAAEITRVHSIWQASRMDRVFLAGTFRGAEYTYQFDRPKGDDWSEAFEFAGKVMARAGELMELERGTETFLKAEKDGEWLPILHTYDGPLKIYASLPLADGRLHVGFAKTTIMPNGRIGMSHLLRNRFEEMSEAEFFEFAGEALGNLKRGLSFTGHSDEEKGLLLTLERRDNNLCAGSAIVLGDFHEKTAEKVGEDKLIVGLISPDHIYVAGASSGWVEEIKGWVRTSPDTSGDLVPSALLIDGPGSMEIIAERPTGRVPADTPTGRGQLVAGVLSMCRSSGV